MGVHWTHLFHSMSTNKAFGMDKTKLSSDNDINSHTHHPSIHPNIVCEEYTPDLVLSHVENLFKCVLYLILLLEQMNKLSRVKRNKRRVRTKRTTKNSEWENTRHTIRRCWEKHPNDQWILNTHHIHIAQLLGCLSARSSVNMFICAQDKRNQQSEWSKRMKWKISNRHFFAFSPIESHKPLTHTHILHWNMFRMQSVLLWNRETEHTHAHDTIIQYNSTQQ